MKFSPKSNEEIQSMNLVEPGIYQFEVLKAEDVTARSGKEMIKLQLKVWNNNGSQGIVFDNLLEAMAYKLRHFSEVTGLIDKYNSGELESNNCIGKNGFAEIIIEQGKEKVGGGYYPDKNSVKDYVKENKVSDNIAVPSPIPYDDSVPF